MKYFLFIITLVIFSCTQSSTKVHDPSRMILSGQKLKTIPDSILTNQNITYLDLGSSNVIFFPPLSALVDSNANELTFIPNEIGNLNSLDTLILNTNKLEH